MASCSSSYTEYKREYSSRPTRGCSVGINESKTRVYSSSSREKASHLYSSGSREKQSSRLYSSSSREKIGSRVYSSSSREKFSSLKSNYVSKDVVDPSTYGREYDSAVLVENCRMDSEVSRLRDIVRSVEHKFQNVQGDLINLNVELKKFRNLNKVYKRALKRQYEINQRMRWRNFENEQENETLRQLLRTLRASRHEMESEFANKHCIPPTYPPTDFSTPAVGSSSRSCLSKPNGSSKAYRSVRNDMSYYDSNVASSSYFPRNSSSNKYRSSVERSSSGTRREERDYGLGKSTSGSLSYDYESKRMSSNDYGGAGSSSKRSTYRVSSYTRLD